jgi:hypothetical protein
MKRAIVYILPLLLTGCLTVDPDAPTQPYAWRVYVALTCGLVFGFWAGWITHASFKE